MLAVSKVVATATQSARAGLDAKLADLRATLSRHDQVLADIERDQQGRADVLRRAALALQELHENEVAMRTAATAKLAVWKQTRHAGQVIRDSVAGIRAQAREADLDRRKLTAARSKLQDEISLIEKELQKYGTLLRFPVRRKRRTPRGCLPAPKPKS